MSDESGSTEMGSERGEPRDAEATVRGYYEAIDADEYDRLADLLAPDVVHERPDRSFEGRETLVGFMRDDRPNKDTSHDIGAVCVEESGDEIAVRGRLFAADGTEMFSFVDVFEVVDGEIRRIRTYTA